MGSPECFYRARPVTLGGKNLFSAQGSEPAKDTATMTVPRADGPKAFFPLGVDTVPTRDFLLLVVFQR